jgi:hypothetical protein
MPNESPGRDPKGIWQNQPTEKPTMTLKLIRQRARELHAKTRSKLLGTLAGPLFVLLFSVFEINGFPLLKPVLLPLSTFALIWSLVGLYFLSRGMWSVAIPEDAGLHTGLEFCKRELERQRDLLRRVLVWSLGPVLLAIGTFILVLATIGSRGRGIFPNAIPFLTLITIWIVAYFATRLWQQREVQREIDQLDEIGRENKE